jgi:glycosyltransferase involved in cell wall biosynthesis
MKIAVYSLTFNRLNYTNFCFRSLWKHAGYPYDHYLIDNGSQDGTVEWLKRYSNKFKEINYLPENIGISKASNLMLDAISEKNYDLIIKMDNDCEIVTDGIIKKFVNIYKAIDKLRIPLVKTTENVTITRKKDIKSYILSPIVNNTSPLIKIGDCTVGGVEIKLTSIVRGVFQVVPTGVYSKYRYPEVLPKSSGQDSNFCDWARERGIQLGYIENMIVNHYNPIFKNT